MAGSKTILCIEDEHFISELYARALNKAGHTVEIAFSGKDGLELAKSNRFDIILLDLMIPDMLGIDVLKYLRKEMPDLKAKIIIATNLEQEDGVKAEIEQQADGYVIKAEVTPRQLVQLLEQYA